MISTCEISLTYDLPLIYYCTTIYYLPYSIRILSRRRSLVKRFQRGQAKHIEWVAQSGKHFRLCLV